MAQPAFHGVYAAVKFGKVKFDTALIFNQRPLYIVGIGRLSFVNDGNGKSQFTELFLNHIYFLAMREVHGIDGLQQCTVLRPNFVHGFCHRFFRA